MGDTLFALRLAEAQLHRRASRADAWLTCALPPTAPRTDWRVALVGNPNCGKTALFNLLTGARQKVANYAGVTVERKVGTARLQQRAHASR